MDAPPSRRGEILNDFIASALIFSTAITELLDDKIRSVFGDKYTLAQLRLLKMVSRTHAGTVTDVAAFLGVSNAAASKAVDRLVKRNLVRRDESKSDRRAIQLSLTTEGVDVLKRYEDVQGQTLDSLFGQFEPGEFIHTGEILDRLSADLVNVGARSGEMCFRCGVYFRKKCILRDVNNRVCYYQIRHDGTNQKDPDADNA